MRVFLLLFAFMIVVACEQELINRYSTPEEKPQAVVLADGMRQENQDNTIYLCMLASANLSIDLYNGNEEIFQELLYRCLRNKNIYI